MSHSIPEEWSDNPPKILIAGDSPYALGLAARMNATYLPLHKLENGPEPKTDGVYDRRLSNLESVFLVIPEGISAAEAMCHHHWLWDWIEKLALGKDCHAVSFVFILGADTPTDFDQAVAASLAVATVNPTISGHAIWRRSDKLDDLVKLAGQTVPKDLQVLRGRREADFRRNSLSLFVATIKSDERGISWGEAASRVADAFKNREYDLDLFCLPPCHRNGNLLREWLRSIMTGPLTPEAREKCRSLLPTILN